MKLLLSICVSLSLSLHPLHLTRTEVKYNAAAHQLEVSTMIFSDDLEAALKMRGAPMLYLGESRENPQSAAFIAAYLQDKLVLTVNGKPSKMVYFGKEKKEAATWCHLYISEVKSCKSLTIKNNVLMEVHDDQHNNVTISVNGQSYGMLLNQDSPSDNVTFK